jgi:hypothetical protein
VSSHRDVLALFFAAAAEARKILKPTGILIAKCQDETRCRTNYLTHIELVNLLSAWRCDDLVVVVAPGHRPITGTVQRHVRKIHSYFLVFRKRFRIRRSGPRYVAVPRTAA